MWRDAGRIPWKDEDRNWSSTVTSQRMSGLPEAESDKERSYRFQKDFGHAWYLDLVLLPFRTVKQ